MLIEEVQIRILPGGRLTRVDAAAYLDRSPKTLAEWQSKSFGPRPRKVGGRVYYLLRDLESFVTSGVREAVAS